ncbi:MAG TPA: indolepyruvate ferredoxin oxidoreductase subunit alpha [Clostridia bacterium]|nr:indolepyruvate ferredoxin oxidoreductase subunit alpha [Clostridia bacterium]
MAELLTGNAAIARGAYESGVTVAAGYPGTPSTEILEGFAKYPGVYAEWAPNEKVALEVGIGASIAGARVLVTMKHVGVNVAADPLFTFVYTGVNGGLVLISADDPGMHSSQNEQDNRNYGVAAKIPILEPSDSMEAKDMVGQALELSEMFDIPVMLRITTRVAHSQGFVDLGERQDHQLKKYEKNASKYVMLPGFGRMRRYSLEERLENFLARAEKSPLNRIELGNREIGVITSGVSYQYVREVLPEASILKLGITYPFPGNLVKEFASQVKRIIVVEELEPYLEKQVKLLGIDVEGKKYFPAIGELDPGLLRKGFEKAGIINGPGDTGDTGDNAGDASENNSTGEDVPARPPVPCPGCPHRGAFYVLKKLKLVVAGDIGCYTLGALPPLEAMDSCICMGASIGVALGMEKANPELKNKIVAVIGDSTFIHSGITGIVNAVYNRSSITAIILDNRTTAMTGHQDHPATGCTLMGEPAPQLDLEGLVRACGVKRVRVVDPLNIEEFTAAVKEETVADEPSVIIARRPCVLLEKATGTPVRVIEDVCTGCRSCTRLGCTAISFKDKKASVNPVLCSGCGLCIQVCKPGALVQGGDNNE